MKLLVATAAACVISSSAFAADILYDAPPAPPAPPPPPAPFNWTGPYVGVYGGIAAGDIKHNLNVLGSVPFTGLLTERSRAGGAIGGIQVGYDWQVNNWVLGAVADIAATNYEVKNSYYVLGTRIAKDSSKLSYLGTVRARAGYAWDRTLVYGHGGFAYGKTKQTSDFIGTDTLKQSQTRTGWTIGAGVEYAVTDRISLGSEYSYVDFGKKDIYKDANISINEDVALHSVKAFLNVRF